MQQISDWLKKLGMSEYAEHFTKNPIDLSVLPDLTDQHLEKLGVALGGRLKILRAIRELSGTTVAAAQPAVAPVAQNSAKRRQLTVVFCDPVGSTSLSATLDPEDLRGIIDAYHRCRTELVACNGGFVVKYFRNTTIEVTQIKCDKPIHGLLSSLTCEDAFLIALQVRDYPIHEYWEDGRPAPVTALRVGDVTRPGVQPQAPARLEMSSLHRRCGPGTAASSLDRRPCCVHAAADAGSNCLAFIISTGRRINEAAGDVLPTGAKHD